MNDRAQFDDPHLESLLPRVAFTRRGSFFSSMRYMRMISNCSWP